jgi:hypothetical protein
MVSLALVAALTSTAACGSGGDTKDEGAGSVSGSGTTSSGAGGSCATPCADQYRPGPQEPAYEVEQSTCKGIPVGTYTTSTHGESTPIADPCDVDKASCHCVVDIETPAEKETIPCDELRRCLGIVPYAVGSPPEACAYSCPADGGGACTGPDGEKCSIEVEAAL